MEYFTADSYKNAERVAEFEENGRMYATVKIPCERCSGNGYFTIAVVNNQPKLSPVDGGVCFKCGGVGYEQKKVRLYTEAEYNKMVASKEQAAAAKEQEIIAKAEAKQTEWLEKNGFNKDGYTYILTGDTYSIKDDLKSAGYKFNPTLNWHIGEVPAIYAELVSLKFHYSDLMEFDIFGRPAYKEDAEKRIKAELEKYIPSSNSEWIGKEKERLRDLEVVVKGKRGFEGMYGWTNVYTFAQGENILTWFTTKDFNFAIDDAITLTGTVKKHDEYRGVKQTVLTRCVVA